MTIIPPKKKWAKRSHRNTLCQDLKKFYNPFLRHKRKTLKTSLASVKMKFQDVLIRIRDQSKRPKITAEKSVHKGMSKLCQKSFKIILRNTSNIDKYSVG